MSRSEQSAWSDPLLLRILIADDVQETRRSTRLMITLIPNTRVVAIAHNGREAVEMAQEHQPDIALIDINMPEMNGITAIETMMRHQPELVCIVISAEKDRRTAQDAMNAGARGYLIKPFTTEQLQEAMEHAKELVVSHRKRLKQTDRLRLQRDIYLEQIADEYAKIRRTDDKAIEVYEKLVSEPNCKLRWKMTLAMAYILRQEWKKLKTLAEKLEYQNNT